MNAEFDSVDSANAGGAPKGRRKRQRAEPMPEVPCVVLKSQGVILIYGRDARAVVTGVSLQEHLDVTVLIAPPAAGVSDL